MATAPYDWMREWGITRFETALPPQDEEDVRSPFERDRARIIHSVAFRRLQGKTQIFGPGAADFMRTRVTHSIEVSQIGRGLARRFGVPGSLVEAACLGHDLGHPPFGHTGEDALNQLMKPYGGFEGNAQSFRIVTRIEPKSPDYLGLDLGRETLHALLKYPYKKVAGYAKYLYDDDAARMEAFLYRDIPQSLLAGYNRNRRPQRTLPCQLMDWADDIAYSVHDLEDGIVSGLLQPSTWLDDSFLSVLSASVCGADIRWQSGPPSCDDIREIVENLLKRLPGYEAPFIQRDVLREMTRYYINRFANAGVVAREGDGTSSYDFVLDVPEEIRVENQVLKSITFEFVIRDARTTTIMYKGREILMKLFEALFQRATEDGSEKARLASFYLFPREMRKELESLVGNEVALARLVCDYIAGMTEGQAIQLYGRLYEPGAGSPFAWT